MNDPGGAALVASQLPYLEPIAAAAMAINLAYLNLDRFRYRREIREGANRELSELGNANPNPSIAKTVQFRHLLWLSGIKIDESLALAANTKPRGEQPETLWAWLYKWCFSHHQDIFSSCALALFAAFILIVGVAHSIRIWSFFSASSAEWAEFFFWFLAMGMALPIGFVFLGRYVRRKGRAHVVRCGGELAGILQEMVKTVQPPRT